MSVVSNTADLWAQDTVPNASEFYANLLADYPGDGALSAFNPTPGTGKTGFYAVPPNNYPFYSEDEKYKPKVQPDGGQWSETREMYNPTSEEAEADRLKAYAAGVPHGYVPRGTAAPVASSRPLKLTVSSSFFKDSEYGPETKPDGMHCGGAFVIEVASSMRVDDLKLLIQEKGGVPVSLQKLAYGGKRLVDPNRTLAQYGVAYWNKRFPNWELKLLSV